MQVSGLLWVVFSGEEISMSWNKTVPLALLAGIVLSAALTEDVTAQVSIHPGTSSAAGTALRPPRQEPCWQVAGVSKSAIQQRQTIARQARQEVEAVCANSSLSIQQKRQQIQQIHQRQRQAIEAIITAEQQEAMRSCQVERNAGHSSGGHVGAGGGGPCGEMPVAHKPNLQHEQDETPTSETAKPD